MPVPRDVGSTFERITHTDDAQPSQPNARKITPWGISEEAFADDNPLPDVEPVGGLSEENSEWSETIEYGDDDDE